MSDCLEKEITGQKLRPEEYSPLLLAYVGDAVYEMFVRTHLVKQGNLPVNELHRLAKGFVSAKAQSDAVSRLESELTDEEVRIYKRGRNAKSATVPKNADVGDYRRATGIEALIGFLYLKGEFDRLYEIMEKIINC